MRKKIVLALSGIVFMSQLAAQDSLKTEVLKEAVITGTKFEVPAEKSGKVIFKINQDQLQTGRSLQDVLHEIPGVQMDGNFGTPGTNIGYYVRGGRSKNSLILIDGIPMVDPSGIEPFFDLRFLAADQLSNVEVLQGGLSTLYGSGASASVINIQTKAPAEDGIHGNIGLEAGSWKTFGQHVNVNGRQGKFSFQLMGSNRTSVGFSAALDTLDAGFDDDGFERRNGLLKIGYRFTENLNVELFGGIDWFDAEFDAGPFADDNHTQKQKQDRVGTKITWDYTKGYLTLTAQRTATNRDLKDSYPVEYDGNNGYAEIINKHELNAWVTLLSGISFQKLSYEERGATAKDTVSFTIIDPYASVLLSAPFGLTVHAGARLNNHSEYGANLVYNVNPSWLIRLSEKVEIKPFASLSTSFITPTLFQLHYPYGGNLNLDPEKSRNTEYGFSVFVSNQVTVTAVNFFRSEEDVIGYTYQYENISDTRKVKGVTLDFRYSPNRVLSVNGDFSWVTTDHKQSFYRIPSRKTGFGLNIKPMKNTYVSLRYQHTGVRTDLYFDAFFDSHEIELAKYDVVDLTVSQNLLKNHLFLYGSVFNLTDEDFTGVYGYTTRGRNYSVGIRYNL